MVGWLVVNHFLNTPKFQELHAWIERSAREEGIELVRKTKLKFIEDMDDDFNSPKALGDIFELVATANALTTGKTLAPADVPAAQSLRDLIVELIGVFGIDLDELLASEKDAGGYPPEVIDLAAELAGYQGQDPSAAIDALLETRAAARAQKDWACADAVRDGMAKLGFTVKDTPQGAQVEYAG